MARKNIFAKDEYYHIYNRGTEKRNIFLGQADYERFLALLYLCNSSQPADLKLQGRTLYDWLKIDRGQPIINIATFCLMSNHFHLLVKAKTATGTSLFMQKLTTGYTMYFNKIYERSGALFQGKFKSEHVANDRYLKYLIAYIHLNPTKLVEPLWKEQGIADKRQAERFVEQYAYSSLPDYLGNQRPENIITVRDVLPKYFETPAEFKKGMFEWFELQGSTL